MATKTKPTRIVIVGAGFGGVYTFKQLHKLVHGKEDVSLILVNPENYFLFTPLLHEVATGGIFPENIIEPLRKVVGCCLDEFHMTTMVRVRDKEKVVETKHGDIAYDYLVLATGATTNFFGTPGAEEHCYTLKSLEDAITLKNRFIALFEEAINTESLEQRRKLLHVVVVGGGPTGVELAAELSEFFYDTFVRYFNCKHIMDDVRITLVQRGEDLLPQFSKEMRQQSARILGEKRIDVRLSTGVTEVKEGKVIVDKGENIEAATVIWTAGVKPNTVTFDSSFVEEKGRHVVDEHLCIKDSKCIYALGDVAAFTPKGDERPLPQLAQVATRQGSYVAQNILRKMKKEREKKFVYRHRGNLVSLGQWAAIAEIGKHHFLGHFVWWVWRTVYLSKLVSWQKKFQVALDWTIDLISPRDISKY